LTNIDKKLTSEINIA